MNIEEFHKYCMSKKGVTVDFPFDKVTMVFRVMNKIFALTGTDSELFKVNLKCNPEWAINLREHHEEIIPGWHMNKKHWNTVYFEGNLSITLLKKMIDHSYELVVESLTKTQKEKLKTS